MVTFSLVCRCGYSVTGRAWKVTSAGLAANGILTKRNSGPAQTPLNKLKRKAIFLLYRILQGLASPAILIWLLIRGFRNRRYFSTLRERFGELPASWQKTAPGSIWLHAVSVGEVLAAIPLIEELRIRVPSAPVFVSTSTLAGRATADQRLNGVVEGVFHAPLDLVWAVRRVLRHLRPSLLVVVETEIWPNLFREARRLGCGLAIVNGRISDRALPRYRKFAGLFRSVLSLCDVIIVQSDAMRDRYLEAGAPPGIVHVGGNLKYDIAPGAITADSPVIGFLNAVSGRPVWIAASTSSDDSIEEEDAVLAAQRELPGWRLIVAPRKPERFGPVADKIRNSGLSWTRRTALDNPAADILLLDSIGELSGVFGRADVVFMGGTLAQKGGHNILEPAFFGKPVIAGTHLENFRDIERHFMAHNALLRIASGADLANAIQRAASDPGFGERALAAASVHRGAAARTAHQLVGLYDTRYPSSRHAQPAWMFLWLFSQLWRAGSAYDRRRKRSRQRMLPVPVVSVGNITAGGTGKTPVTIELLQDFHAQNPGLLTRGHGRSTSHIVLLPKGTERLPVGLTGDEAQLYIRNVGVPIGVGGDRFRAGTKLLAEAAVRIFFLDDGLQHIQLARDFNLVLIDSLNPFGGGHLLPLGRLREPLEGLARADAFIITRAREAVALKAIESVLRYWNPVAPIFRSHTVARRWSNEAGDHIDANGIPGLRSIAFCGLGNPEAFWNTLAELGVNVGERYEYGDHHRYKPSEIRRLAQRGRDLGMEALLTTSKDSVNLFPGIESMIAPLKLYWLEIGIDIERHEELLSLISSRIFPQNI
jgi:3-deoxy-D-manno-octulosonic-acid transferase